MLAAEEFEADKLLIRRLWGDYSDSWYAGVANAMSWIFEHNHPDMGQSIESLGACYGDAPEGYREPR